MPSSFIPYISLKGDTFDSIALDFYNHENLSFHIIQANPEFRNTLIFQGGEELVIPIIEQKVAETLPPWKREA